MGRTLGNSHEHIYTRRLLSVIEQDVFVQLTLLHHHGTESYALVAESDCSSLIILPFDRMMSPSAFAREYLPEVPTERYRPYYTQYLVVLRSIQESCIARFGDLYHTSQVTLLTYYNEYICIIAIGT